MPLPLLLAPTDMLQAHVLYQYSDDGRRSVRLPTSLVGRVPGPEPLTDPYDIRVYRVYLACCHFTKLYNDSLAHQIPPMAHEINNEPIEILDEDSDDEPIEILDEDSDDETVVSRSSAISVRSSSPDFHIELPTTPRYTTARRGRRRF